MRQRREHVRAVGIDRKHRPAVLLRPAREHRRPVARLLLDGEADVPHVLRQHARCRLADRPRHLEDDHRLALVAGRLQFGAGGRQVELGAGRSGVRAERRAAHPERRARLGLVAVGHADRRQRRVLVGELPQHAPHRRIVERRRRVVEAEVALELMETAQSHELHAPLLLEQRQHVERQVLHVVDLAHHQGVGAGRLVGHDPQHETVDVHLLAAGEEVGLLLARHVVGIAFQHHRIARPPLALDEAERSRADRLGDALVARRGGETFRQHDRQRRVRLAQHVEQERERLLEDEFEGLGVDGIERGHVGQQHLAQRIAPRPSLQRGHAIGGRHRRAVVPLEAIAQGEGPGELVGAGLPAVDHLRLDLAGLVHREQRVEDMQREGPGDVHRRGMGIEDRDLGLQDDRQRFLGARRLRLEQRRSRQHQAARQRRTPPKITKTHVHPLQLRKAA